MIKHPLKLAGCQTVFSLKQLAHKINTHGGKIARFRGLISQSGLKTIKSPITFKIYFILIFCLLSKQQIFSPS